MSIHLEERRGQNYYSRVLGLSRSIIENSSGISLKKKNNHTPSVSAHKIKLQSNIYQVKFDAEGASESFKR